MVIVRYNSTTPRRRKILNARELELITRSIGRRVSISTGLLHVKQHNIGELATFSYKNFHTPSATKIGKTNTASLMCISPSYL